EADAGMPVRILRSGRVSRIDRIATFDGDLNRAAAGRSVTFTLTDEVDASRGDIVAEINDAPDVTDRFSARVFWMDGHALAPGRGYMIKAGTATASAKIEAGLRVVDPDTHKSIAADQLAANEIGICTLKLDREVAVDRYADAKETGSFILLDPETYDTVGMGCIEETAVAAGRTASALTQWIPSWIPFHENATGAVERWTSTHARSLAKAVIWRVAASLMTFLMVYLISDSTKLAISIAAAEIMVKTLFYYFHERMWMIIRWGKR